MGRVPEDGQSPRLPLSIGEWIDPSGAIPALMGQWYFCKALEIEAPECLEDLVKLDELTAMALPPQEHIAEMLELTTRLSEWCEKWHLKPHWLFWAGTNTLIARYVVRQQTGRAINIVFLPYPFGTQIPPEQFSAVLNEMNPGWVDSGFDLKIPGIHFKWHPTQHTESDMRQAIHGLLDERLDELFGEVDSTLSSQGQQRSPKGKAASTEFSFYRFAVRHVVLGQSINSLEKEFGKSRGAVRRGIRLVAKQLQLETSE